MEKKINSDSIRALKTYFLRNGCFRKTNFKKRKKESSQVYKKGYEIRFVAHSKTELAEIRHHLRQIGLKSGKTYIKSKTIIVQPVYGRENLERFCLLTGISKKKIIS